MIARKSHHGLNTEIRREAEVQCCLRPPELQYAERLLSDFCPDDTKIKLATSALTKWIFNRLVTTLVLSCSDWILVIIISDALHINRPHSSKVLISSSDPERPVGASVSEDHALRNRVAVDKSFVSLLLKTRRVPALLHHLDGHLRHCKLIPVGHLGCLMVRWIRPKVDIHRIQILFISVE